jgi:hypothetical protein
MLCILILAAALTLNPCDNPYSTGTALYTFRLERVSADLDTLPRTPALAGQIGICFATRVFVQASENPRQDADSAVWYLHQAVAACPNTATLTAYTYAARLLQAQYRYQHETLFLLDTLRSYFSRLDTLARCQSENLVVQFIAGCVLQNAPAVLEANGGFWNRSRIMLQHLDELAGRGDSSNVLADAEVRANIRLNLAHLLGKSDTEPTLAKKYDALREVVVTFPGTWAAHRAAALLQKRHPKK